MQALLTAQAVLSLFQGDLETFFDRYGLYGVVLYIIVREVIPLIVKYMDRSQVSATKIAELKAVKEAEREERSIRAFEQMVEIVGGIREFMASVNVRLAVIERALGLPTPETYVEPNTVERKVKSDRKPKPADG